MCRSPRSSMSFAKSPMLRLMRLRYNNGARSSGSPSSFFLELRALQIAAGKALILVDQHVFRRILAKVHGDVLMHSSIWFYLSPLPVNLDL